MLEFAETCLCAKDCHFGFTDKVYLAIDLIAVLLALHVIEC